MNTEKKILFRDYLKQNPKEAEKYYEFKKKCMREANSNPSKYRELKDSYIKAILERARKKLVRDAHGFVEMCDQR